MQVEKTFIVAEPIEEWIGGKKIILGYELRKVYTDFDNTYYIIEREGKLSKITAREVGEYRDNIYRLF